MGFSGPAHRSLASGMMRDGGSHEARKQRVRLMGLALELRVELAPDEVWVTGQLDHLDETVVRGHTRKQQASTLEILTIHVVYLVPMTVTFTDLRRAVNFRCK